MPIKKIWNKVCKQSDHLARARAVLDAAISDIEPEYKEFRQDHRLQLMNAAGLILDGIQESLESLIQDMEASLEPYRE